MANSMDRFTQRARRVLSLAHQEAERLHHNYIGTEHLLLGLILEEGGVASRVLRELGLETRRVQEVVERLTGYGQYRGAPSISRRECSKFWNLLLKKPRRWGITT
jgi:ATP-dependent Clp protease ATP-binding subunit ClpC